MSNPETIQQINKNSGNSNDIINGKKEETKSKKEEQKKELRPEYEKSLKENSKQNAPSNKEESTLKKKETSKRNSITDRAAIFQQKKPQDNANLANNLRQSLPITKRTNKMLERFNTSVLNQKAEEKRRSLMYADTNSMMKKVESSNVQEMKKKIKKIELSKKEEEEEKQKEIKRRKTIDITNIKKINEKVISMAQDQEKENEIRRMNTLSSMDEKVDSDAVQRVQEDLKKMEIAKKEEEEERQKEIKRKKTVDKEKLAEINLKVDTMLKVLEGDHNIRRRNSIKNSSMAQKVVSFNVERMKEELINIEIAKKEKEEKIQKEIKEKKIVDKAIIAKMYERIEEMEKEKQKFIEEKVNTVKTNYSFSENAKDNFKNNLNLFQLNEEHVKDIFGEQSKELSEEEKMHLFDKKINNCEIKEKINLNITMKNPNKEYKYETEIYDEEGNLIAKTEKKGDKNEITLSDNSELVYKFTKTQLIKLVLTKYTSSNDKIKTIKTIPLKKIISKNNDKKFEEKIEDFTDNEVINIDYGLSEETKDQKVVELNFNALNKDENKNLSYCIQKDNKVLFKSAVCNSTNIKKSDQIKLSDLEPEFQISFYNEEFEEKKVTIKTKELKSGVSFDLPNVDGLKINISSEETKYNSFLKLLEEKNINLDLSIAIDFTCSNGLPQNIYSLHYIKDGFMNNYEKSIREHYKIISLYNKNDKYNVYGFGADINGEFKKIFNLNGTDNPSITGIENIISEYKKTVNSVEFSGATYFAPIIREVKRKIEEKMDINSNYHILLIISDGEIFDIRETIDSIIEASKLPISFIIIGIGADVTSDMKTLNGEKGKLISSNNEELNKDIVQYVHFKDFANNLNKLANEVLKYIPQQITSYFKEK